MNRIALLLALALCLPLAARADEASHRAKAEEMMSLLHTERQVEQNADAIMKQVSDVADQAIGPNPTPDAKAKAADFEKQARQMVDDQVSWKVIQSQFTDIYAKSFTDEELDGIIAFYKSPAGSALLTKMPDINQQISQFAGGRVQAMRPQLQQLFTDFKKNLAPPPPFLGPVPPAAPAAPSTPPATKPN
ncbi:MAG: DUF2059 domain-containing protein [Acidobacteriaceae bacterium]|jgi:hypothetical protein